MSILSKAKSTDIIFIDDLSGSHSSKDWCNDSSTEHDICISRLDIINALYPYATDENLIAAKTLFLPRERLDASFVVSLEPPEVFPCADFYLAMSRAVSHPAAYGRGPCHIVARQGATPWEVQLLSLKKELSGRASTPSITILDDGFAGGLSLIWLHDQLQRNGIEIEAFAVAFNTHGNGALCDKPVINAGTAPWASRWLHARDLAWGAPGSGMGLLSETLHIVGGVPYSLLRSGFAIRTGLDGFKSIELRTRSITLSNEIYQRWEAAGAKSISVSMVKRLRNIFLHPHQRVRSLLEKCASLEDQEIAALLIQE